MECKDGENNFPAGGRMDGGRIQTTNKKLSMSLQAPQEEYGLSRSCSYADQVWGEPNARPIPLAKGRVLYRRSGWLIYTSDKKSAIQNAV